MSNNASDQDTDILHQRLKSKIGQIVHKMVEASNIYQYQNKFHFLDKTLFKIPNIADFLDIDISISPDDTIVEKRRKKFYKKYIENQKSLIRHLFAQHYLKKLNYMPKLQKNTDDPEMTAKKIKKESLKSSLRDNLLKRKAALRQRKQEQKDNT